MTVLVIVVALLLGAAGVWMFVAGATRRARIAANITPRHDDD